MAVEHTSNRRGLYGEILSLAVPACLSRFAVLGLTLVSSLFVGHAGFEELAYLAISASLQNALLAPAYGLLAGFPPAIARANAAQQRAECHWLMRVGSALAVAIGCLSGLILWQGEALLGALNQPAEIIEGGTRCLIAFAWGMPAMMAVYAGMIMLEAMGRPRLPLAVMAFGNLLNLLFLIWLPSGAEASAVATSLARWGMAVAIVGAAVYALSGRVSQLDPDRPTMPEGRTSGMKLRALLKVGGPIGLAAGFETAAFTALASMAGMLGAEALAGYQVAQNLYRIPFVIVAAIGIASGVRAAAAVGRGEARLIRSYGITGMQLGGAFLILVAGTLLMFPIEAVLAFTPDPLFAESMRVAVIITAVLIVFDGAQGHLNNLLRGLSDATIPSLTQLFAFWVVATPLAYLLAFEAQWGLNGLLVGLTTGLAVGASLLLARFFLHPSVR